MAAIFTKTEITIEIDTEIDMSSATGTEIHYRKPDGTTGEWSASASGNKLTYTTSQSDMTESGIWKFQSVAIVSGNLVKGEIVSHDILLPIKTT